MSGHASSLQWPPGRRERGPAGLVMMVGVDADGFGLRTTVGLRRVTSRTGGARFQHGLPGGAKRFLVAWQRWWRSVSGVREPVSPWHRFLPYEVGPRRKHTVAARKSRNDAESSIEHRSDAREPSLTGSLPM